MVPFSITTKTNEKEKKVEWEDASYVSRIFSVSLIYNGYTHFRVFTNASLSGREKSGLPLYILT